MTWAALALYLCFFIGMAMYVLIRASFAVHNSANPVSSHMAFLSKWWDVILFRAVCEFFLFIGWWHYPDFFGQAVSHLTPWKLNAAIPVVAPTAFAFGLCIDFLVDAGLTRFDFYKKRIVQLPTNGDDAAKGQGAGN